jgi:glycosyltransferase involved in cell wall biosynthesis
MIRVLQLLDAQAEWERAHQALMLQRASGGNCSIICKTLGRGGSWRNVPCAAAILRRECHQFDLIHAWGEAALAAAALGSNLPIIFNPPARCAAPALRRLHQLQRRERVEVICPSEIRRRALIEHGVWAGRCRVIRPGFDIESIRNARAAGTRREGDHETNDPDSLRARLGLSRNDYVLLAPGESTRLAGHVEALWAVSILHVSDPKYKLLTWGRGPGTRAVRDFAAKTGPEVLCDATQRLGNTIAFERLLHVADAVVWAARGLSATLAIGMCMSARLPIVSARSQIADELLMDGQSALMCDGKPRTIAQRILDLVGDCEHARAIAAQAQLRAGEFFDSRRFISQTEDAYEHLLRLRSTVAF